MIELGQSAAAPSADDLIKDVTEATFMVDVVDASNDVPVIVDFWAPWCGPCKTLGPQLEAAVIAAKGAVKMAKVDVDQAQQIAGQLQIQSIPTVYAFHKGQPIDGFQGAVPESEVKDFVARVVAASGGSIEEDDGLADAIEAAEAMLADGDAADAAETFAALLEENPTHVVAYAGWVRALIAAGDLEQAEGVLNGAPAEISDAPELEAAHAQLELAKQAAGAGPLDDLGNAVESNPDDHQARFDYALALHANGQVDAAVDQLLTLFSKDREWNDGAAKAQLFTVFEALPANDPIVLNGRRRLSSLIFA